MGTVCPCVKLVETCMTLVTTSVAVVRELEGMFKKHLMCFAYSFVGCILLSLRSHHSHHSCCCCQVASVVSDSVQPQRRHPTRLPRPWDSPGKNTGVGCHFLLQYMKVKSESEVTQPCPTLSEPMDCSLPGSIHGIFQAKVLEWGAITFSAHHSSSSLFPCFIIRVSSEILFEKASTA